MVRQVAVAGGDQVILGASGALVSSRSVEGGWHVVRPGVDGRLECGCQGYGYRRTCRHLRAVDEARSARQIEQDAIRQAAKLAVRAGLSDGTKALLGAYG